MSRSEQRWDEVDSSTPLGRLVSPYRWITYENDEDFDPNAVSLGGHLVADGTIQLCNPGFDGHLIGIDTISWYGFGHCALLAWHLHRLTGWQLVTLVGTDGIKAHTGVLTPDGQLADWRGVQSPADATSEYASMRRPATVEWRAETADEWIAHWLPSGDASSIEVGGHTHQYRVYDEFELLLTDHLAHMIVVAIGRIEVAA